MLPELFINMALTIEKIFMPSTGVDIVFNMNTITPHSRSSIIYDIDYKKKEVIIAQPLTPITSSTTYDELHLTTILQDKGRKLRAGVVCTELKIIKGYKLANNKSIPVICLKYKPPVKETNIRSAFRLPLSKQHVIKGKILLNQQEYLTPHDFSIRDISLSGIGLHVIKKKGNAPHPLSQLENGDQIMIGIILIDTSQTIPSAAIPMRAQVTRINTEFSQTHILIGFQITGLKQEHETILGQFIHKAQVDELKRLSGRS